MFRETSKLRPRRLVVDVVENPENVSLLLPVEVEKISKGEASV